MTQKVLDLMRKIEFHIKRNYSSDTKLIGLVGEINKYIKSGNQWIPVGERLPDTNRKVLVTYKLGTTIASYNTVWISVGRPRKLKSVTAWQELPKPYK
jgi:hypothetical protein